MAEENTLHSFHFLSFSMIEFIPYIPFGTPNVEESIWNIALLSWKKNLTHLLNMQDIQFLDEIVSNTSLSEFVHQVWNDQLNNTSATVDTVLIQYIFLLYKRLSSLNNSDNLESSGLVTTEKLCSFVLVYGESNTDQVRQIMTRLINGSESLEQSLLSTLGMLVDSVGAMPSLLSNQKPLTGEILLRAYVIVKVLNALLSSIVQLDLVKELFDNLDDVLISCYEGLIPILKSTVEKDDTTKVHAYIIKQSLVSCFNTFADIHFFTPLGYISSTADHHKLVETNATLLPLHDTIIDFTNEKILGYIEQSGLESSKTAFVDGPLIMDWQSEYHITEKLDYINQRGFDGEEERIEFLKLSMEQVRDAIESIGSWGDALVKYQQKEKRSAATTTKQSQLEAVYEKVTRIRKISQIHDLFPDLGDGFIEACLEATKDDVELVIMQLLEDTLPESVAKLDRSMESKLLKSAQVTVAQLSHLESEAAAQDSEIEQSIQEGESILKTRRNIYDNDEFDIFAHRKVDTSKVYAGKKDKGNADKLLDDKSFIQAEKKNVLQRVVDMYDDDYDDTYDDINDAGTMPDRGEGGDAALDIVKKKQQEALDPGVPNESVLVHAYVEHPDLFTRNGTTRKSTKRAELRQKTGMTDEQLEGWAIMFNRNVSYLIFVYLVSSVI